MAQPTGGDILIDVLTRFGVDVIFGMPGDGINGIMEALRTRADQIRFVQVRHEESAAFMACAYAKYTGKLGVCLATSGPGGIHLLNGLYDAKFDGQPVLAIAGEHYHDLLNTHSQQDVDLEQIFADVSVYNARIMGPEHVRNVAELACRKALSRRGVACLSFPVDFQSMSPARESERNVLHDVSTPCLHYVTIPDQASLEKAAATLNAGTKVAILAGRGALGASDELEQIADLLAAPIVKPLLGKAAVPDDSPFTTGGIGLLGTLPSHQAIEECDTLLMVGTSFPYKEFLPAPGTARGVQIDVDAERIDLRYPIEVGLVGDAKATLERLIPLLHKREDRSFLEAAQNGMVACRRPSMPACRKRNAFALVSLGRAEPTKSLWFQSRTTRWHCRAASLPTVKPPVAASSANPCATLDRRAGRARLPYAIAAQIAYPDRPCIALVGDGGFTMLMCELLTAVKYQLPIKIVIFRNDSLGQIKWEQMVFLGNPEFGCELQPMDFVKFADACGARGFRIEDPEQCSEILDQALATKGPVLIEAVIDPHEPPMPPEINLKQATRFATALAKGTPHRGQIMSTVIKNKIREMV